jgi:hypothetical protein
MVTLPSMGSGLVCGFFAGREVEKRPELCELYRIRL